MRRLARVVLLIACVPVVILFLWLLLWGGVLVVGSLNGTYSMAGNEPNRLYIVSPAQRRGSLLFLGYGCARGQPRVVHANTWTIAFDRHGLACTTDLPPVIKGGLTGAQQYRDAHGTHLVVPFFRAAVGTALYDLTDVRVSGWCGNGGMITVTIFVWGDERFAAQWERRKHAGISAIVTALRAACLDGRSKQSS